MRHVDALRPELARHALRERAQRVLCAGEGGEVLPPADGGRRAGVEDRAAPARHHPPRHLAAHEKAAEAGHLPDLEVLARGLLEDARRHVGADVERGDLDRSDVALDLLDERDHLLLFSRVTTEGTGAAAVGLDLGDERAELVRRAPDHAGDEALAREALGDRAAGAVTGADDEGNLVGHGVRGRSTGRGPVARSQRHR